MVFKKTGAGQSLGPVVVQPQPAPTTPTPTDEAKKPKQGR